MIFIFNFIRQYWLTAIAGILVIGASVEHLEVTHLKREITAYKSENIALVNANQQLSAAIKAQDAAVAKLQVEAHTKAQAAEQALKIAQKNAGNYARAAERIGHSKTSGNTCKDMTGLLNLYVRQGK